MTTSNKNQLGTDPLSVHAAARTWASLPYLVLEKLSLNDEWRLGEFLPKQSNRHASVYSVHVQQTGQTVEDLEAHVFALDPSTIPPKIRKHRLRCIKRMEHRTKLEVRVNDMIVVVIGTSMVVDDGPEKDEDTSQVSKQSATKSKSKTDYQRESARIRQQERRQARRFAKGQEQLEGGEMTVHIAGQEDYLDDRDSEFTTTLTLLWILYDESGLRKELSQIHADYVKSSGFHDTLKNYMDMTDVHLDTIDAMESYLRVRRTELISLQRHQARLADGEKYHHEKLGNLYRKQAQFAKNSDSWRLLEDGPKDEAVLQLRMVRHAKQVAPKLLASRRSVLRSVERKLARIREKLSLEALYKQRKELSEQVSLEGNIFNTIFPGLSARGDAFRRWQSAKKRLKVFDQEHPEVFKRGE